MPIDKTEHPFSMKELLADDFVIHRDKMIAISNNGFLVNCLLSSPKPCLVNLYWDTECVAEYAFTHGEQSELYTDSFLCEIRCFVDKRISGLFSIKASTEINLEMLSVIEADK